MPQINVLFWNIENFGSPTTFKSNNWPLASLIAWTANALRADIIFIEEVKQAVVANPGSLLQLHQALCTLPPAPANNWYFDLIKGSLAHAGQGPYATSAELDWDDGRQEGYAMFWNQNIAKFQMTPAPPLPGQNGLVANSQSETVRTQITLQVHGAPMYQWGIGVPAGGIVTPNEDTPYIIPAGTTIPGQGQLQADTPMAAGTALSVGTTIGGTGVRLAAPPAGYNPILIPGNYTLTDQCTLPAAGSVLVPEHALSLVIKGLNTMLGGASQAVLGDISGQTQPYGANYQMQDLWFPRGPGFPAEMRGPRRPAYATIDVNIPGPPPAPAAERLVPLIAYHAPLVQPSSTTGMQRAAYSQPVYQAYDWTTGAWIDNQRVVVGGDFNVATDTVAYAYNAFMQPFAWPGANCQARVYEPPPPREDVLANRTTVQLNNPPAIGPVIFSQLLADYRLGAVDNAFYRGFTPRQAPLPNPASVFDFLPAVSLAAGQLDLPPILVQRFLENQALLENLWVAYNQWAGPAPELRDVVSPQDLVWRLDVGDFSATSVHTFPARAAAEFIRKCVSDHLPVIFTMDL